MNKKILLVTLTLLAVVMMATPMVGTAQACKWWRWREPITVDTFTLDPSKDPPGPHSNMEEIVPPTEKFLCDDTIRIAWGAERKWDYNGPLGVGTLYMKTILSVQHMSVDTVVLPPPYGEQHETGYGGGFYKWTLEIDGDYGTGTLKGIARLKWEWDFSGLNPLNWRLETWTTATLYPVEGDLDIIKVYVEGYSIISVMKTGSWWTTTKVFY